MCARGVCVCVLVGGTSSVWCSGVAGGIYLLTETRPGGKSAGRNGSSRACKTNNVPASFKIQIQSAQSSALIRIS